MTSVRFPLLIVSLALFAVAGCNTIGGAGKDIQAGGKAIEETSDKVSDEMSD